MYCITGLLNLRGKDIPSSSTFFSFIVMTQTRLDFFVNPTQVDNSTVEILRNNIPELSFRNYEDVYDEFPRIVSTHALDETNLNYLY